MATSHVMRITWFFNGFERGWSETLARQTPDGDLVAARENAIAIAQLRSPMLGAGYKIEGCRVADYYDNSPTGTRIKNRSLPARFLYEGSQLVANVGDQQDQCVQAEMVVADGARKKLIFMGGVPQALDVGGGAFDSAKLGWQGFFNSWVAGLKAGFYGWISDTKSAKVQVTGFAADNATGIVTFTVSAGTFGAGPVYQQQSVRVSGLNGSHCPLNRQLVIQPLTDTTCATAFPIASGPFRSKGSMLLYVHPFVAMDSCFAQDLVERKRGRPTLQPRGRSPKRVAW